MLSEVDVDELVSVVVTVQRQEAVVNKSLMPSEGNDEEPVLDVAVERDEAAMIDSVEVAVGENASLQLVIDSTGDDAWSISFQLVFPVVTHAVIFRGSSRIS